MSIARRVQRKSLEARKLLGLGWRDVEALRLVRQVREQKLTYLEAAALVDLYDVVQAIELTGRAGIVIEAGVALGGSALILASAKARQRPLHLYDAFEMIPPPSAEDGPDAHQRYQTITSGQATGIGGDHYYGYRENLLDQVVQTFDNLGFPPAENTIRFIKGYYEDTLIIDEPVAVAHIDCDWYGSVMCCLEQIVPNLIPGGTLIIDDYEAWSGCRKAVDDYFAGRTHAFNFTMRSRLHIRRHS